MRREILFTHERMGTQQVRFVPLSAMVRLGMIKAAKPDWLIEADQREADAKDERATVEDVRYGGCP